MAFGNGKNGVKSSLNFEGTLLCSQPKKLKTLRHDLLICPSSFILRSVKGEVRAIGRFWVFDRNGLLGDKVIDSRWFEKNPPTESGWKRRSKNRRSTGISRGNDRDVMSAFDFAPIYTPFDEHAFLRLTLDALSIAGGWRKCDTLLMFCQTIAQ